MDDEQQSGTNWRVKSLWLEPRADEKLRRLAGETGRSRAALIREAVNQFLKRAENKGE